MREEEKTKMENSDNNNNLGYRIQIIVNTKVILSKKLTARYLVKWDSPPSWFDETFTQLGICFPHSPFAKYDQNGG